MSQDRSIEQFLRDMRQTADLVSRFVAETDELTFTTEPGASWAIERGVIQLGEIASQMRDRHPEYMEEHPELDPAGLRALRNIVVHGYAQLDLDRVWQIAIENVPGLGDRAHAALVELTRDAGLER